MFTKVFKTHHIIIKNNIDLLIKAGERRRRWSEIVIENVLFRVIFEKVV